VFEKIQFIQNQMFTMKNTILLSFLLLSFLACKEIPKAADKPTNTPTQPTEQTAVVPNNFEIVLGKSVGAVSATANYADLVKIFGEANLTTDTISEAEGTKESVATFVKKETPEEVVVIWHDAQVKKSIDRIQIAVEGSPYKTTEGVKIGTTLAELEKMNGKPISFYGFGWDYGGLVESWKGGNFDKKRLLITLHYIEPNVRYDASKMPLMGDGTFNSDDKKVKEWRERIKVQLMEIEF
jgi:hypothetical protein